MVFKYTPLFRKVLKVNFLQVKLNKADFLNDKSQME